MICCSINLASEHHGFFANSSKWHPPPVAGSTLRYTARKAPGFCPLSLRDALCSPLVFLFAQLFSPRFSVFAVYLLLSRFFCQPFAAPFSSQSLLRSSSQLAPPSLRFFAVLWCSLHSKLMHSDCTLPCAHCSSTSLFAASPLPVRKRLIPSGAMLVGNQGTLLNAKRTLAVYVAIVATRPGSTGTGIQGVSREHGKG